MKPGEKSQRQLSGATLALQPVTPQKELELWAFPKGGCNTLRLGLLTKDP